MEGFAPNQGIFLDFVKNHCTHIFTVYPLAHVSIYVLIISK